MANNQLYTTFSKELLITLNEAVDLPLLISNDLGIELKRSGKNYWLCCPFHTEKTPSFTINNNNVLRDNNYFYTYKIKDNKKVLDFLLNERGISLDNIKKYNLGFVTSGISSLLQKKYSDNLLIESGLFTKDSNSKLKDLLKYRITIPIFDEHNKIISFSGRRLPDSNYPKYINGLETPFFQKKDVLYGLNFSKKDIHLRNTVFIVEGYFDHIILSQHNVKNSVATMGTSITSSQLDKIFTLADNIIFCFDGDTAGIKAALKVAYMCLSIISDTKNVSFVFLAENHDPDSFIRNKGIDEWHKKVEQKESLSTFIINDLIQSNNHNPTSVESNVNIAVKAKNIIDSINSQAIFYKNALKIGIENKIGFKI